MSSLNGQEQGERRSEMDAGTRGLDGDGVLVFTGGCVKTRGRKNKAEKCVCPGWRTFPLP